MTNTAVHEQMLAMLVMDLGYTEEPLHGHAPIRHQIAWSMCVNHFTPNEFKLIIVALQEQNKQEMKAMGLRRYTVSAEEANCDVIALDPDKDKD